MSLPINDDCRLARNQPARTIRRIRAKRHRRPREMVKAWEDKRWGTSIEGAVNGLAALLLTTAKNVPATRGQDLRPRVEVAMREDCR